MSNGVLIVASKLGYQTRRFAEVAREIGLEAVMVTDRCHQLEDPWGDGAVPFREADQIVGGAGVLAVGDRPGPVAAALAARLGLRFHPVAAVESARNKYAARERFRAAGMRVPGYFRVNASAEGLVEAIGRARFPCVLKPLGLSGSRGVIRADTAAEFQEAFRRIESILRQPDIRQLRDQADEYVQVEDYIPGKEYALEGLAGRGRLRTLAVFDKPDALEGPFFEETIYVTPARGVDAGLISEAVQQAVMALGLTDGPVHAEVRVDGDGAVWVLEVAGRPIGGLCSRVLVFNGGVTLEEILLRNAVGERIGPLTLDGPAAGVMMIPIPKSGIYAGVTGEDEARGTAGIEDLVITARPHQELKALPEGSSYLGFLFSRGQNADAAEQALRRAHACLRFEILDTLPMMGG